MRYINYSMSKQKVNGKLDTKPLISDTGEKRDMWHLQTIERRACVHGFYTAFERSITDDFVFRGETHDFYEIVFLLEGSVGVTAGANSFVLEGPAAILHPPMEFHSLRGISGKNALAVIFAFEASSVPPYGSHRFILSKENIQSVEHVLHLLQNATQIKRLRVGEILAGHESEAQQALLEFEMLLLTLTENGSDDLRDGSAGARNYRRALRVIEENLHIPLDTATLARLSHMSPSLLKKTFSRYAGVGVMEYLRTRKVNAAIPRLRAGESVKDIAASLGFSDAGYFSTTFRRVTGHSPTYYRRN